MLHFEWTGSHYEAGLRYGTARRQMGMTLGRPEILQLTSEKLAFGRASMEICRREYPEFLEELEGIAQGQEIPLEELCAFFFGMYNFIGGHFCTSFAFRGPDGVVFGRNSDFAVALEPTNENSYYHLTDGNAFVGNSTAPSQMEDGVNCHGLAVGLTLIYPTVKRPGLGAGILTRYLLERCSTVPEAVEELGRLTISSNQTLTLADRAGRMAVVECNCQGMEVLEPEPGTDFVVATNSFHGVGMKRYNPALEDTVFSGLRYQVAKKALDDRWGEPVAFAQELLAGKFGFLCQYDRSKGMDTVWSSIYCLSSPGEIYRCEGNPSRQSFERDCRLKF
ncbi:C45 family autoproteolytic acyltransferase/hydrolase [Phocea massiliensis]|uniref:C45 family autoproteolytic acyltransferase/hydolase n=1 Tax=Merdimmobilis hominis TaxID=2897707 RepID=UPI000D7B199F|nr:C45 family peptidase [Merdimmobilis hominis]MCD4836846.1 C45 family autoproteolytic acyltransferase/hydrolase [Merdimmobilis hominis]PWL57913.1 MAG: choloylglycine hydrolase [Oscillospiraceae bacterium]